MSTVSLERGDLFGLDRLDVDALVLPFFEERAQPRHVAGYIDWRLSGRIARLLLSGKFSGKKGEVVLMGVFGRLKVQRIFLFGLGAPLLANAEDLGPVLQALRDAGVSDAAFAPPAALSPKGPPPAEVLERWQKSSALQAAPLTRAILLDLGPGQKLAAREG
ncbi:MAG: M17 family peptidase N-terminal domain-containing protein [Myxococcota bacterium]